MPAASGETVGRAGAAGCEGRGCTGADCAGCVGAGSGGCEDCGGPGTLLEEAGGISVVLLRKKMPINTSARASAAPPIHKGFNAIFFFSCMADAGSGDVAAIGLLSEAFETSRVPVARLLPRCEPVFQGALPTVVSWHPANGLNR